MRFFDGLTRLFQKAVPYVSIATRQIPPERKLDQFLQAYTYWSYACARAIAENVADVDFRLFAKSSKGKEEQIEKHAVLDLLSSVNPHMTEYDLREMTQIHLELVGEAWWAFEKGRFGPPQEIWPLIPTGVTIIPDAKDFIAGISYLPPGVSEATTYAPDEFIQFKYAHPASMYRGWSPTRAAALPLDVHQYAQEWVRNFFFNDATPGGILSTDQPLTETQSETIRQRWTENHRGKANAHRIAVIGMGAKFQTIDRSLKDLAFTDEQKRLRDDILGIYGVPKSILGIADDVNRANAEAAQYVFAKHVIKPRLKRIEQRLNEFLVHRFFDERLVLRFADPVPDNREQNLKEATEGFRFGLLSLNEGRRRIGEDELPGDAGTVHSQLGTSVFVKPNQIGEETPPAATPPAADTPPPASDGGAGSDDQKPQKGFTTAKRRDYEAVWRKWIERTAPQEKKMISALKRFFQWEQDQVMDRLKQLGKGIATKAEGDEIDYSKIIDDILWAEEAGKKELADRIGSLLRVIVSQSGSDALSDIGVGISFDVEHPAVKTGLKAQMTKITGHVEETTREALRVTLTDGLNAGESIPQLADRVSNVFTVAKGSRAEMIARTETNSGAAFGSTEGYRQSGVVKQKEWISAIDERTRTAPYNHVAANGEIVGIDEFFTRTGQELSFPGHWHGAAANVINCRCAVAPVTITDEEGG